MTISTILMRSTLMSLLCFSPTLFAKTSSMTVSSHHSSLFDTLANQQDIQQLSQHITWRRLLIYTDNSKSSRVPDDHFFISPQGKTDPQAELIANLTALSQKETADDYLCRFPARSHWLMQQLPSLKQHVQTMLGYSSCAEVDQWLKQVNARQLTLIHAEEHINRIASAMAHTLVRIDNDKSLQTHNTDDAYFFNFATDETIKQAQGLTANLKALVGRGIGSMTFGTYTDKQASYLIEDERDIWQYTLDLPQESIDQIMRHTWELLKIKRYYNFLNNNCASEVLRMIDMTQPQRDLVKHAGKIIAPPEVSRILQQNHLLKDEHFIPSALTVQRARQNAHQARIDYDTFLKEYAKSAQYEQLQLKPSQNNPLNANKIHRVMFNIGQFEGKSGASIAVRGASQDFLDRQMGKRDFLNLTMMSGEIGVIDDKLTLRDFTLVENSSFNPLNRPSPRWANTFHLKMTTVNDASTMDNAPHHVLSNGMEYGASWQLGLGENGTGEMANTLCYTLAGATLQAGHISKGFRAGVNGRVGCAYHINDKSRLWADLNLPYWYHGDIHHQDKRSHYLQPMLQVAGQYDLGKNHALRLSSSYQKNYNQHETDYKLSYIWHFD